MTTPDASGSTAARRSALDDEVLGMVIGTAAGLSNTATVVLSVVLAFVFAVSCTRALGSGKR